MATLNVGRIAMKIAGREAGKYCTVLTNPKDSFVQVTGPKILTGVKRRRCNIEHLEPTEHAIKIDKEASDKKVIEVMEKEGLIKKLDLEKPSPEVVKEKAKGSEKTKKTKKKDKKETKTKKDTKKSSKKKSSKKTTKKAKKSSKSKK